MVLALYVIFVIGALSRATFQILTEWERAPLAYSLSAFAALVYVVATVSLAVPGDAAWRVSVAAIGTELVGVLVVGTWSVLAPESFPDQTVWSVYGQGYLFVPLVLPVLGLWWLFSARARPPAR